MWRRFIQLDQTANVEGRRTETLTIQDRQISPVYHFDIPVEKVSTTQSQFIDASTDSFVKIKKDGKEFVRFFIVDGKNFSLAEMKKAFGEPQQTFFAARMQSKATYFVWNPEAPEETPFFVKMQRKWTDKIPFVNQYFSAKNGVQTNDALEKILAAGENPPKNFTILPERFAANVKVAKGLDYAYSVRSVAPLHASRTQNTQILPTHATLGSQELPDLAHKSGLNEYNWLAEEYIPKYADFLAEMNFGFGLYPESHTQNILMEVERDSGKIVRFISRDSADTMVDIAGVKLNAPAVNLPTESLPANRLNEVWLDAGVKHGKKAGYFMISYPQQAVSAMAEEDSPEHLYFLSKFFARYIEQAEKILGKKLNLSPTSIKILTNFKNGTTETVPSKWEMLGRSMSLRMSEYLTQDIQNKFATDKFQMALGSKVIANTQIQNELKSAFSNRALNRGVSWSFPGSEKSMKSIFPQKAIMYALDGNGIWAYDKKTNSPIGFAYNLDETTSANLQARLKSLAELKETSPASRNAGRSICSRLFRWFN